MRGSRIGSLVMGIHTLGVFASGTRFPRKVVRRARQMLAIDLAGIADRMRLGHMIRGVQYRLSGGEQGGYG
jgi:hypothetical protein